MILQPGLLANDWNTREPIDALALEVGKHNLLESSRNLDRGV